MTITVNDELANYYFEERPWLSTGSYKDRFLVRAVFSNNVVVSDIVEIMESPPSTGEKVETAVKVAGIANSVLQRVAEHAGQLETVVSGPVGKVVAKVTPILNFISWFLTGCYKLAKGTNAFGWG